MGKSFLLPVAIVLFVTSKTFAFAQDVEIPRGPEVTAKSGVPTVIYGQRSRKCKDKDAPDFDRVIDRAVTRAPEHGSLSDGGEGKRRSRSCGKRVPVRAIAYTSEPGFVGTDIVIFWDVDVVVVTVVAE